MVFTPCINSIRVHYAGFFLGGGLCKPLFNSPFAMLTAHFVLKDLPRLIRGLSSWERVPHGRPHDRGTTLAREWGLIIF